MWSFRSSLSSLAVVNNSSAAIVRRTQPSQCQCFHRCAKYLSPHSTSKGGNNNNENNTSNSAGDDNGAGTTSKTTSATVPIQTYNKSPIVAELWRSRDEAKKRVSASVLSAKGVENGSCHSSDIHKRVVGKHPKESQVGIPYLFTQDTYLLETYRNPWGEMRFGKILEDLDALAGNIAFHHVAGGDGGVRGTEEGGLLPLIVTASVDRIRVRSRPDISASDQYLSGKVTFVGSSSLEIRMNISSIPTDNNTSNEKEGGEEWLEAYFTFVTLHPITKKAISIPPLLPETQEECNHYELGARKAQTRKEQRQQNNNNTIVEQKQLFINTRAKELLLEAGPLLQMPSLANPNTILISSTIQSNALIAQPQSRNLHDRIFGGFLMRRAFELAFATAYLFGGDRPKFIEVDDVSFDKPVDVGNLLVFKSLVLHTWPNGGGNNNILGGGCAYDDDDVADSTPLVVVEVECWITVPETTKAEKSNNFYFTFALPNKTSCRRVLPANIDQARRQAARMYEYEKI
jgi:acyl-coenzyme A thioesterase 9